VTCLNFGQKLDLQFTFAFSSLVNWIQYNLMFIFDLSNLGDLSCLGDLSNLDNRSNLGNLNDLNNLSNFNLSNLRVILWYLQVSLRSIKIYQA